MINLKQQKSGARCASVYQEEGFRSRAEYLKALAADYGVDVMSVCALAGVLGASEDFDGLVCAVQDLAGGGL